MTAVPSLTRSPENMKQITFIMALFSSILRAFGGDPAPPFKVADIYRDMRAAVLKLKPADLSEKDDSKILAVVMDTGFPEAAFTLVATMDGSASLYFSNGGGIIGAGAQPEGEKASKALIAEAAKYLSKMTPTKETPIVRPDMTTFYVVTGKGVSTVTAKEEDFGEDRHVVSPLFHKAHELISVIRAIDEARAKQRGSAPSTKEGEPGADGNRPLA